MVMVIQHLFCSEISISTIMMIQMENQCLFNVCLLSITYQLVPARNMNYELLLSGILVTAAIGNLLFQLTRRCTSRNVIILFIAFLLLRECQFLCSFLRRFKFEAVLKHVLKPSPKMNFPRKANQEA